MKEDEDLWSFWGFFWAVFFYPIESPFVPSVSSSTCILIIPSLGTLLKLFSQKDGKFT